MLTKLCVSIPEGLLHRNRMYVRNLFSHITFGVEPGKQSSGAQNGIYSTQIMSIFSSSAVQIHLQDFCLLSLCHRIIESHNDLS